MSSSKLGERYGNLIIIDNIENRGGNRYVKCVCDCGNLKEIRLGHLVSGKIVSCGCYFKMIVSKARTGIDGTISNTRLYKTWVAMKQRCYNKKSSNYKSYGGKGIFICNDWLYSFKNFMEWSNINGYDENKNDLSIDRINPVCEYCPENCRWITRSENSINAINYNYQNKTGMFSAETLEKIKSTNRDRLGVKLQILIGDIIIKQCNSLSEAAEFIKITKAITTEVNQLKKNISACLRGKRKKCHGYNFTSMA